MVTGHADWHRRCPRCSYEGSTLQPYIREQVEGGDLDEAFREEALSDLRQANFRMLTGLIATHLGCREGRRPRLLDVGCAHGWFLQAASPEFEAFGIEPDPVTARAARQRASNVREGFFPDVLDEGERFDVIVFNDVLEHIPDVRATLAACRAHLNPGGVLIVNAPSRRGVIYRCSAALARVGVPGLFGRMWQLGFPSPHVHYFDTASIVRLAQRHGMRLGWQTTLPSMRLRGLYQRIRYDRSVSNAKAGALWLAAAMLLPLLWILPADIEVWALEDT